MEYKNKKLQEFEEYIRYRKVAIIGLGVSNLPLIDYMYEKKARVTVFDDREKEKIPQEIRDKIITYQFDFSFGYHFPFTKLFTNQTRIRRRNKKRCNGYN